MSERIPCISLWQPWASLLMLDAAKVHETRSWMPPLRVLGLRFAIHAAKRKPGPQELEMCELLVVLLKNRSLPITPLPMGAVLGTAVLAEARATTTTVPKTNLDYVCGDWSDGRYAWRFESRRPFVTPVPLRGRQGIWWESPEVLGLSDQPPQTAAKGG